MSEANEDQLHRLVGHSIRVLLTGEHIDGFVQPNGGWKIIGVEDGQDDWDAIRKAVGDIRRVVRYEQNPSPCEGCRLRAEQGNCRKPKRTWDTCLIELSDRISNAKVRISE
jgi:hypothetical protein